MVDFYLGLPDNHGELPLAAQQLYDAGEIAGVMASASRLWDAKRGAFRELAPQFDELPVFIDSAGFVATSQWKGYPWTPEAYVASIAVMNKEPERWSAMDLCVEPEVAPYRAEVRHRVEETARLLARCLRLAAAHRSEDQVLRARLWTDLGQEVPEDVRSRPLDPMPILQGWEPDDYLRSAELTDVVLTTRGLAGRWPDLVGIGSVCKRHLNGPDGLVAILSRLDAELPAHVGLHLFGVHSAARAELEHHPRVRSLDSQAWGATTRRRVNNERRAIEAELGVKLTPDHPAWVSDSVPGKVEAMAEFAAAQQVAPRQTSLLGRIGPLST